MKKAIAIRLLKSKKARQIGWKALQNEKVRDAIVKQVGRRLARK